MRDINTQQKEQIIVGTIINANNTIKEMYESLGIKKDKSETLVNLMENNHPIYHYNMVQLFGNINSDNQDMNFTEINHIELPDNFKIQNERNNYYTYFQKVHNFLAGFEPNIQKILNESLQIDGGDGKKLDIFSFRTELKTIIDDLEKINDTESLSKDILRIKTFSKSSIQVYGYNISNNLALQREITEKFGIKILAICFDKTNKQILFVPKQAKDIVVYDVKLDKLEFYNNLNSEKITKDLSGTTYLQDIKGLIHNNIIELWLDVTSLNLQFEDNLYFDKMRKKIVENNKIVK